MHFDENLPETSKISKMPKVWFFLSLPASVVLLILYIAYPNPFPDFRPDQQNDSFIYIHLAKSILAGEGYQTKHWMPGFPILLSIALSQFGLDFLPLKLAMISLSFITIFVAYHLFKHIVNEVAALPLALLLAATATYFDYSHRLMSEIPFTTFSLFALLSFLKATQSTEMGSFRRSVWTVALLLATLAAVLIRGNGLALASAFLVGLLPLRHGLAKKKVFISGLALCFLVGAFAVWSYWCSLVTFDGIDNITYLQEVQAQDIGALWKAGGYSSGVSKIDLLGLIGRIYENSVYYISYQIASIVIPTAQGLASIRLPYVGFTISLLLSMPVFLGLFGLMKRSAATAAYLLCSLALLVVYPTGGAPRMLILSLPLLIVAAYLGITRMCGPRLALGWISTALWISIIHCGIAAEGRLQHPYSYDEFGDFIELVVQDIPSIDISSEPIVAPHAEVIKAFTRRKVISQDDALRLILSSIIPKALFILRSADDSFWQKSLPANISYEILARRGEFTLARIQSTEPHQGHTPSAHGP